MSWRNRIRPHFPLKKRALPAVPPHVRLPRSSRDPEPGWKKISTPSPCCPPSVFSLKIVGRGNSLTNLAPQPNLSNLQFGVDGEEGEAWREFGRKLPLGLQMQIASCINHASLDARTSEILGRSG